MEHRFNIHRIVNHHTNDSSFLYAGFTLVELLVVISVLGIISVVAVMLINPQTQFNKAHDGTRKSHMAQIQAALEFYRGDNNYYPPSLSLLTSGSPKYIDSLPIDPSGTTYENNYLASPSGCDNISTFCSGYRIWACLESDDINADVNRNPPEAEQCSSPLKSYSVKNP